MARRRIGLSAIRALALLGALPLALACGGTTRQGGGQAGQAGQGGQASGGSGVVLPGPCAAMDARSSGDDCAGIAGYRYNGRLCEGIACSCVGRDCARLFGTMEECDRAHRECYAAQGLSRDCQQHHECYLAERTCCPPCGTPLADTHLALRFDAPSPQSVGSCLGDAEAGCPRCPEGINPGVYAACIDSECTVVDVTESARCQADEECRLVSKDCCDCGGDFGLKGVMSVNRSYVRPDRCDGVYCDACLPQPPTDFAPICRTDLGVCSIIVSLH